MRSGRKHHERLEREAMKKERKKRDARDHERRGRDRKRDRKRTAAEPDEPRRTPNAVVVSLAPGRAEVWHGGRLVEVELPPDLQRAQQTEIAVGDAVCCEPRADRVFVVEVAPRRSSLARPDPGNSRRQRVIVANVDVAVVVLAARRPRLKPALIDRYLVAAAYGGVEPVLCINKVDLLETDRDREDVEQVLARYRDLRVPVVGTSAKTGEGLAELRDALVGRTVVFVGHSGVGKSALLNRIDPDGGRAVSSGRAFDGKGRHTTRGARLTELSDGTRLIDTAGVREFGLWGLTRDELRHLFPEFVALASSCRFADCSHVHEPRCAVRAAVEVSEVSPERYGAYRRLLDELERP